MCRKAMLILKISQKRFLQHLSMRNKIYFQNIRCLVVIVWIFFLFKTNINLVLSLKRLTVKDSWMHVLNTMSLVNFHFHKLLTSFKNCAFAEKGSGKSGQEVSSRPAKDLDRSTANNYRSKYVNTWYRAVLSVP